MTEQPLPAPTNEVKTILVGNGERQEFDNPDDAYRAGQEQYGPGNFTIEKVGERSVELGWMSLFLPTT